MWTHPLDLQLSAAGDAGERPGLFGSPAAILGCPSFRRAEAVSAPPPAANRELGEVGFHRNRTLLLSASESGALAHWLHTCRHSR